MSLLANCSSLLTKINLSNTYRLQVNDACIDIISNHCPYLQHLDVSLNSNCYFRSFEHEWGQLTDNSIISLSEKCCHLETISLIGNPKLTNTIVDALLLNCLKIKDIDLMLTGIENSYLGIKRKELKQINRYVIIVNHPSI